MARQQTKQTKLPPRTPTIAVVGCGFLGSLFIEELCKLCFAFSQRPDVIVVDNDEFERRNAANQNVTLADAEDFKAVVAAAIVEDYELIAHPRIVRVTRANIHDALAGGALIAIVDTVDNLATRQLLYEYGLERGVPVLHLGISEQGTGSAEWSHPAHDTFALAPWRLVGKPIPQDPESGVLPPCELVAMRALGWQIAFCGALSVLMYLGHDPEHHLVEEGGSLGWLTDWSATPFNRTAVRETWTCVSPEPGVIVVG